MKILIMNKFDELYEGITQRFNLRKWNKSKLPDEFKNKLAIELKSQGFGDLHGVSKNGKEFLYLKNDKILDITNLSVDDIVDKLFINTFELTSY